MPTIYYFRAVIDGEVDAGTAEEARAKLAEFSNALYGEPGDQLEIKWMDVIEVEKKPGMERP